MAGYKGRPLGAIGDLGSFSFHETKNIISGEGGSRCERSANWCRAPRSCARREPPRPVLPRRGRQIYLAGVGSSFLPSEITAAFLWAQLEQAERITAERIAIWHRYHEMLAPLEQRGVLRRPVVPPDCQHNGHIYYILVDSADERAACSRSSIERHPGGVSLRSLAFFACGHGFGRCAGDGGVTTLYWERTDMNSLMWLGLSESVTVMRPPGAARTRCIERSA